MRRFVQFTVGAAVLLTASASAFSKDTLTVGEQLGANEYLQSNNGNYRLYMQGDGNLVLRDAASNALWGSHTEGKGAVRVKLLGDGNLMMYGSASQTVWATGASSKGAVRALLRDDGNFVLYTSSNVPVWRTNTAQTDGGTTPPPSSGGISRVGTSQVWDPDGLAVTIVKPAKTQAGDLMVLALHKTDGTLPFKLAGWTRRAECYKEDNGYQCLTIADCTTFDGNFCTRFKNQYRGLDLAQVIFTRTATATEPSSYSVQMTKSGYVQHPGWAILTTFRGANTSSPVRDWAHKGCDNDSDSLFPAVDGRKGDMLLLSQSFDDFVSKETFGAPNGMTTYGYVGNSDETGFLYGATLTADGSTGVRRTNGPGGSGCKDALISITIKPQ